MLTENQIDQAIAELHDGIRSLDIWDALWLMGVQAKQAIDLAAENERLKAKLDALDRWFTKTCIRSYKACEEFKEIMDKGGDET